jgi:hypothetical protein
MGYFRFFVLKDGAKLKKISWKGTHILFWGDKSIILKEQNYFFGIFKDIFQNFGGTFVPPTQDVGPLLRGPSSDCSTSFLLWIDSTGSSFLLYFQCLQIAFLVSSRCQRYNRSWMSLFGHNFEVTVDSLGNKGFLRIRRRSCPTSECVSKSA